MFLTARVVESYVSAATTCNITIDAVIWEHVGFTFKTLLKHFLNIGEHFGDTSNLASYYLLLVYFWLLLIIEVVPS